MGNILDVLRNGINCKQDKSGIGDKISRIESISQSFFNINKVGYANLSEHDKFRYRLQRGDILFSHINSPIHVGKSAIFESDELVYHGVNLLVMRPTKVVTPSYLDHALKHLFQSGHWFRACKQSVNQASVNQQDIAKVEIHYPKSLSEQQRIVGILDEAFDGIATAKANAEKNLQNARAILESHLQSVFMRRDKEWVEKQFSEVCEISSALVDPRLPDFRTLYHVGGANIGIKTGSLTELKTASDEGLISGKFIFDETMVLYSKIRPYLIKVARPNFKGLCSADIYPLSAKKGQLNRDFLFHLLLATEFTEYAIAGSARSGMPKVNRDHLFAFRAHLPPIADQVRYAEQLDALHEQSQHLETVYKRKISALDELKKSLLHQAFSGNL